MTVDNSALLNELLGNMHDKEAASAWGVIAQQAAEEEANRPTYWRHANKDTGKLSPKIVGKITKISTKPNFDKDGVNPVLDLDVDGKRVIVEAAHRTLQKELAKLLPQTGDFVSIECKGKPKGKNYFLYDVKAGKTPESLTDEVGF